jgi:rRNA maturation RNase YbeY
MTINICLTDRRFSLDKKGIKLAAQTVLMKERARAKDVDLIFCRNKEITILNRRFKGRNGSTDVLAFDLSDKGFSNYLGEVYVNLQMARRQAGMFGVSYSEEVRRLTIHGVLHLLGFNDNTEGDRARMWARQESYIKNGTKRRRRR